MEETVVYSNPQLAHVQAIHRWLETFAAAVRDRDFAKGRALCIGDIFSFGTVTNYAQGLDELESCQWQRVWGITTGFAFDLNSVRCGGDGDTFWAGALWSSQGRHKIDGVIERRGRATIILQKMGDKLLAAHTHFSLAPSSCPLTLEGTIS
jgi:ketosteroid isomerase-like protein